MAIKVIIERRSIPGNELKLNDLLTQLRSKAMHAKGYITGETLRSVDDSTICVVISTWDTLEDWKAWFDNKNRKELQAKIDDLLRAPSQSRVFSYY
jgi:heme-degrading monooxygenase HmoA